MSEKTLVKQRKVAILQSNYIPWKGYFDQINSVDTFVLYDCVQFTRRDWRNRNKIKTSKGLHWLTIPVQTKGNYFQRISETLISGEAWAQEHFLSLKHHYSNTSYFKSYEAELKEMYAEAAGIRELSRVNHLFMSRICKWLEIKTPLLWADDFELAEGKSERLLSICEQLNADVYISGPAAKNYLDESLFNKNGLKVEWADYSGYKEYRQLHPPFEDAVSILDLLFNEGPKAHDFMKSFHTKL